MKKIFLTLLLIVPAFVLVQGVGLGSAQTAALTTSQIQYPVDFLGFCDSEAHCQDYCTNAFNYDMCYEAELSFGVEFLTDYSRGIIESVFDGTMYPIEFLGYCDSQADCQSVCTDALKYNLCYEIELQYGIEFLTQSARDITLSVMDGSIYPMEWLGQCDSYNDCYTYCQNPTNQLDCYEAEQTYGLLLLTQEQRDTALQSMTRSTSDIQESITVEQPPAVEEASELEVEQEQEVIEEEAEEEGEEQERQAQSTTAMSQIEYPIEELGYCDSAEDCQVYCDDIANYDACLAYGVANRMYLPARERMAQAVLEGDGPNECLGSACTQTCESVSTRLMCVEFAAENGDIEEEELEVLEELLDEGGPGGCVTEEECEAYCAEEAHVKECIDFAVEHGLMEETERERVEELRSDGPGGCRGEIECEAYCAIETNFDECMRFAIEHGLMTPEEEEYVYDLHLQTLDGPGGCRGEIECEAYCAVVSHEQECLQFALDNRLDVAVEALGVDRVQTRDTQSVDTQSIEYIIVEDPETGGEMRVYLEDLIDDADREFIHPEGCDTIDECRDFCDLPENKDECLPFAG